MLWAALIMKEQISKTAVVANLIDGYALTQSVGKIYMTCPTTYYV